MEESILQKIESKSLEFKSIVPKDWLALIKTCIAFANGAGGQIILGVDDTDHKIIGIAPEDAERLYHDFPGSLFDATQPSLIAQIYEQNLNNKNIMVIEIPLSPKKPYFLKSEGIPKGVYLRVGSSTRRATPEYIEDLIRESQRITFDAEITNHPYETLLSADLIEDCFGKHITKHRLLSEQIIGHMPANPSHYGATHAGILLFNEAPHQYIPGASSIITRFKGTEGRNIIRTHDIEGPIPEQSSTLFNILENWLSYDYSLQKIKLAGKLPVPEIALREAIINALIHRKYSIHAPIKIAVYDDHLEIFNPGNFPGLINMENLTEGYTYLRNPVVARIARRMGLAEKMGSGIKLIFDSCKEARIKAPKYSENGDFVKITFFFMPSADASMDDKENILSLLTKQEVISAKEAAHYLGIHRNTAARLLNALVKEKKIQRIGKGPSVRYMFVDHPI